MRKNFNQEIMNGKILTYDELQKLDSTWKRDYIQHQLIKDKEVMKFV